MVRDAPAGVVQLVRAPRAKVHVVHHKDGATGVQLQVRAVVELLRLEGERGHLHGLAKLQGSLAGDAVRLVKANDVVRLDGEHVLQVCGVELLRLRLDRPVAFGNELELANNVVIPLVGEPPRVVRRLEREEHEEQGERRHALRDVAHVLDAHAVVHHKIRVVPEVGVKVARDADSPSACGAQPVERGERVGGTTGLRHHEAERVVPGKEVGSQKRSGRRDDNRDPQVLPHERRGAPARVRARSAGDHEHGAVAST